jgi:hypothetical protein
MCRESEGYYMTGNQLISNGQLCTCEQCNNQHGILKSKNIASMTFADKVVLGQSAVLGIMLVEIC